MYWPLGAPKIFAATNLVPDSADSEDSAEPSGADAAAKHIRSLRVSRGGQLLAATTATTLSIWHTSPAVLIASAVRSKSSLSSYGESVNVLIRPDAGLAAVQTSQGFLITYSITFEPNSTVFQQKKQDGHRRKDSNATRFDVEAPKLGHPEALLRFRMVMKIDAGIHTVIAVDEELIIATSRPAAVQCIQWSSEGTSHEPSTEVLQKLPWMKKSSSVMEMVHDRAMSLYVWVTADGRAYAVQRNKDSQTDGDSTLFRGYCFHDRTEPDTYACKAAINARFSLIAIACRSGEVHVYSVLNYNGNLPLSHTLTPPASSSTVGQITTISFSPDGYCIFVGYQHGWAIWSVYGRQGAHTFHCDRTIAATNQEQWLLEIQDSVWLGGGAELLLTSPNDHRIWMVEMVRNAVIGCHSPANVARTVLYNNTSLMLCNRDEAAEDVTVSPNSSRWDQVQMPASYLNSQRPIRSTVISPDGKYIAIAGKRGLAHYSIQSGRWKTFDDPGSENAFVVRGGMCWYQHILIVAVEMADHDEIRLYSRETSLSGSSAVYTAQVNSPIVTMTLTGEDSLLVYTHENLLYHFIIQATDQQITLQELGHIGVHGIVRSPSRVRAVTWIIPDLQLLDGDPANDVHQASILFLVDAKLVLLQPMKDDSGGLRYDMKLIASDVEYYSLTRDHTPLSSRVTPPTPNTGRQHVDNNFMAAGLQDSLWYFDGRTMHCWPDVQELVSASMNDTRDLPRPVPISNDFYPTSVALDSGIFLGIEPDIVQRRDVNFALNRFSTRTQLFIPSLLRHYLEDNDASSALSLSQHFKDLPYFPHALEVLLHDVLDDEVDSTAKDQDRPLLPGVLSFLASFPSYLDIVVQCTRKTEVRSWRTLFRYLPAPSDLFEEAIGKDLLKTAGGYLLIMHTLEEGSGSMEQCVKLLQLASARDDWELCSELARFLMAMDETGTTLRKAMQQLDLAPQDVNGSNEGSITKLGPPGQRRGPHHRDQEMSSLTSEASMSSLASGPESSVGDEGDYFFTQKQ